jgi:hypothetical protein
MRTIRTHERLLLSKRSAERHNLAATRPAPRPGPLAGAGSKTCRRLLLDPSGSLTVTGTPSGFSDGLLAALAARS